jgi:hypothetical protein
MAEPRELSQIDPVNGTDTVRLIFEEGEAIECRIAHYPLLYELAVWTLKKLPEGMRDDAFDAASKMAPPMMGPSY